MKSTPGFCLRSPQVPALPSYSDRLQPGRVNETNPGVPGASSQQQNPRSRLILSINPLVLGTLPIKPQHHWALSRVA